MIDLARRSVLVLELNEAERHFLERFVAEGRLPHFARLMREGVLLSTRVPGWDARKDRAWRDISPWIVWPSLYTGLLPEEHGIVGFGQDTRHLRGKFVWEVLDAHRVPVGVFGSLMSYPPRTAGSARFYVPEGLADGPECIPDAARPVQEFNVLAARNYSEGFARQGVKALGLLLRSTRHGVRIGTALRTIAQLPAEKLFGAHREPERAMLASAIAVDAFEALYREHRPAYAALHLNHVAYMQHRYWRAAEPQRFEEGLSETDQRFFGDVAARRAYEERFAHWIRTSFEYSDRVLGRLVELAPEGAVVLVATALGQRPFDPCHEIHNPVVRLVRERELLDALGLADYTVLHQMNPDVTVNLRDEASAARAAEAAAGLHVVEDEPLFTVQRRGAQVFLELNMPRRSALSGEARIRHRALPGL
ncbi:MAG TPA: alkaline phosphatase family protein, partial [Planctomycetota bacterium]|nr:alkaline phosphatase family protein [Planctomycetota bacterium]